MEKEWPPESSSPRWGWTCEWLLCGSFVNPLHGLNLSSLLPTLQLFLIRLKIIVSEIRPPLQTGKRRRNTFKISTRWE